MFRGGTFRRGQSAFYKPYGELFVGVSIDVLRHGHLWPLSAPQRAAQPFWLKGFCSRVFALGRLGFLRVALESFSLGCNGGGIGACNVLI